jgi:hypothetical protein
LWWLELVARGEMRVREVVVLTEGAGVGVIDAVVNLLGS